jgi:TRAP-type C4-dicarboxylate transport system permease small subunit
MPVFRHIIKFSDQLSKFLMVVAAAWALALAFLIVADITASNVYGRPIHGVREIVISSVVMIVYLQLGYAIRSHCMLRADTLLLVLPITLRRILLAVGYALGVVFFLLVLKGTINPAIYSWTTGEFWGEGALRVPVWPTRFMVLFGSALAIVNYVVAAMIDVFGIDDDEATRTDGNELPTRS